MNKALSIPIFLFIQLCYMQSCKKINADKAEKKIKPDYIFTGSDRQWFIYKIGDTLKFNTSNGRIRQYKIGAINEFKCLEGPFCMSCYDIRTYYSNHYEVYASLLNDTAQSFFQFRFKKTIPAGADPYDPPHTNGRMYHDGFWSEWNGKDGSLWIYFEITNQLSFVQLNINNKSYNNVITVLTNNSNQNYTVSGFMPRVMDILYYDKLNGPVRLVERNGTEWNRVSDN